MSLERARRQFKENVVIKISEELGMPIPDLDEFGARQITNVIFLTILQSMVIKVISSLWKGVRT